MKKKSNRLIEIDRNESGNVSYERKLSGRIEKMKRRQQSTVFIF